MGPAALQVIHYQLSHQGSPDNRGLWRWTGGFCTARILYPSRVRGTFPVAAPHGEEPLPAPAVTPPRGPGSQSWSSLDTRRQPWPQCTTSEPTASARRLGLEGTDPCRLQHELLEPLPLLGICWCGHPRLSEGW